MSVAGRDRAAEVGGDLAQAIARARWARSRHKDATETHRWNEEDPCSDLAEDECLVEERVVGLTGAE